MGKKQDSTIENRVYLFKDLAAAFLTSQGTALASADEEQRRLVLRALGDIAYVSCVVADNGRLDAAAVGALVRADIKI